MKYSILRVFFIFLFFCRLPRFERNRFYELGNNSLFIAMSFLTRERPLWVSRALRLICSHLHSSANINQEGDSCAIFTDQITERMIANPLIWRSVCLGIGPEIIQITFDIAFQGSDLIFLSKHVCFLFRIVGHEIHTKLLIQQKVKWTVRDETCCSERFVGTSVRCW